VTEAGKPYFVMEYVPGPSLTAFADTKQLTVHQRLELFLQACAAVQHAHQKAIIHRDLKPSNILVTERDGRPTVRVIDFGVATAMRKETTARTTFIDTGELLGTPEYMAPEQAQTPVVGVDTRTDVYSLGVVLYELLSGALPFDAKSLRSAGYEEIQRIIREVDPPRPSTRLSGLGEDAREIARRRQTPLQSLERQLKSELEWIPLKAMHKDREERYATATELAADVENYLASRPLRAGPESRSYRARKFVKRNRMSVAVITTMLALLLAGTAATTWQAIRATRAERVSRDEADRAAAAEVQARADAERATRAEASARSEQNATSKVNEFLIDMFQSVDPRLAKGKPVLVADVLDKASAQVEMKLKDQPEVEAAVRAALGIGYYGIAQYDKADPHVTRSLELYRKLHGEDHSKTLEVLDLLGILRHRQGKFAESLSIAQDAYARHVKTDGAASEKTFNSLNNVAVMQQLTGDMKSADAGFRGVWQGYVTLFGPDDTKTLDAERKVAQMQTSLGRYDEAEAMLRDVDTRLRRINGENDIATVNNITELARVMHYTKKFDEAEKLAREGLERSKVVYGENHSHTLAAQYALAIALSDLERGDAIDLYLDAVKRSKEVSGPTNPATLSIMNGASIELSRIGRHEEAIALNRESLTGLTATLGEDNPQRLSAMFNLCRKLHQLRRWEESLPYAQELYDRLGEGNKVQFDANRRARFRALLGVTLANLEKHAAAEPLLLESQKALAGGSGNEEVLRSVLDALIVTSRALANDNAVVKWTAARAELDASTRPTTRP
jgi:non-specific serine/threonine protein kinase/serine/threonine-protein kinase